MRIMIVNMALTLALSQANAIIAQASNGLPDRYAVVIGISAYKNPNLRLRYAAEDARQVRNSLITFGRFKEDNVRLLTDDEATRENIRKNIEGWLKRKIAKKDDLVLVYFSGHGTQIIDTDGDEIDGLDECLVPWDVDIDDNSSLISDDEFAYWIRNLQSERVLIIFDNCFSGGAAREKGILLPGMKGGKVEDDFSRDLAREVPRHGTALLAASKPEQVSFESDEFKNGVFTHYLIEAISPSADNNLDGMIDAHELFYYVRQKTLEYSEVKWKREQEPIFVNAINEELDIYYLPVKRPGISSGKMNEVEYKFLNETNSAKRIEILNEALRLDPTNLHFNIDLAEEYARIGNYAEAVSRYKYLMSLDLRGWQIAPPLSASLAGIYTRMSKVSDAFYWYSKALEESPNDAHICSSVARLYLSQRDTSAAIQYFNRSITAQRLQKDTYLDLFYVHLAQGSFGTAHKIISTCYGINPNDFQAIYWMGMFEKYYNKNLRLGDSLLTAFESSSGVKIHKDEIAEDKSNAIYLVNGRDLKGLELQQYVLNKAIADYPYYADFYKAYIVFADENKLSEKVKANREKYLTYSKLNPDPEFIGKFLK
jgi:uncharacterized caspase-like protein/Tfp pilus assembly protein PilF